MERIRWGPELTISQPQKPILSIHFPAPKVVDLILSKKGGLCWTPASQTAENKLEKVRNLGKDLQSWHIFQTALISLGQWKHTSPSPPSPGTIRPHDPHIPMQSWATWFQAGVLIRTISPCARAAEPGWKASRHKLLWPDQPFFNPEQTLKCCLWYFKKFWSGSLTLEICVGEGEREKKKLAKEVVADSILVFLNRFLILLTGLPSQGHHEVKYCTWLLFILSCVSGFEKVSVFVYPPNRRKWDLKWLFMAHTWITGLQCITLTPLQSGEGKKKKREFLLS